MSLYGVGVGALVLVVDGVCKIDSETDVFGHDDDSKGVNVDIDTSGFVAEGNCGGYVMDDEMVLV